jgi:hypothetical protein
MTPKPKLFARLALIALLTALQLSVPVAGAQAAKFDEKLKAPEAPTNDELKAAIREYFDVYARATAESSAGMVRDKAAHAKWFDTQWSLHRAIDTKRDLGDLSQFGITPKGDGIYSIDLANFPQWTPLQESLTRLVVPDFMVTYASDLKQKGFRDQDLDIVAAYIRNHQPRRAALAENTSLSESFVAKVELQLAKRQKIQLPQMMSYLYQSSRNNAEATRVWGGALLESLDSQRQRILESYFDELDRSSSSLIAPDDANAQSMWLLGVIASGQYRELMEKEKQEALQ